MVQVGDTVWVKAEVGEEPAGDHTLHVYVPWRNFQNVADVNIDAITPDIPGVDLAALVALFAEVGPEYIVGALSSAHGHLLEAAMSTDEDTRALIEAQAEMIRRLAAALGGGK